MDNKPILEACVETLEQAILAEDCGADRIELCADLSVGGLTPTPELLVKAKAAISIPIMAMARPRGGNFIYNKHELREIKSTIDWLKNSGVYGVVFGFLTKENLIDLETTKQMVDYAYPLQVTFHKAIDLTPNPVEAAFELSAIKGIQRILTSGGKETALEGMHHLKEMQKAVKGKLTILVAGKVTKENLDAIHTEIGANEYHGRRIVF